MTRTFERDWPALLGGGPVRTRPFPYLRRTERDLERLAEVLGQDDWGGIPYPNAMHRRFAAAFSEKLGGFETAMVANGSVAISIALRALGLKAGDEVLVPALTWVATASAAIHVNLVPVLVDVEPRHLGIDCDKAEAAITPKTRAIVVVHLANQIADMDRVMDLAQRKGLHVVEDCAHAHFARWRGRPVGTIGDAGTFSFEGSKIITSGEGGAITSRRPDVMMRAMSLANVGRKQPPYDRLDGEMLGFNARASEFQAAVLLGQIELFDERSRRRRENLERLLAGIERTGGLIYVQPDHRASDVTLYEVLFRYDPSAFGGLTRERFCAAMLAEGVEFEGQFYDPLHRSPLLRASSSDWPMLKERYGDTFDSLPSSFPVAEKAAYEDLVWIHHPLISGSSTDIDDILRAISKVQKHAATLR